MPPLLRRKGAPANFLRGSRQIFDTENTDRVFLWFGIGNTGENTELVHNSSIYGNNFY